MILFIIIYVLNRLVGLEMLYNMPDRRGLKFLCLSAEEDISKQRKNKGVFGGGKDPFDNKCLLFKTYFRYLPGSVRKTNHSKSETNADMIIDDASLDLDVNSKELFPYYEDSFSSTAVFIIFF